MLLKAIEKRAAPRRGKPRHQPTPESAFTTDRQDRLPLGLLPVLETHPELLELTIAWPTLPYGCEKPYADRSGLKSPHRSHRFTSS